MQPPHLATEMAQGLGMVDAVARAGSAGVFVETILLACVEHLRREQEQCASFTQCAWHCSSAIQVG